jgi:hypothetical protein
MSVLACDIEPILGILDIDGSIMNDYFHDPAYHDQEEKLRAALEQAEPYSWMASIGLFDKLTEVTFVTGRKHHQYELTVKWIRDKLNVCKFDVHTVHYINHEKYILDKLNAFGELVTKWIALHGSTGKIVFIDDDREVLKRLWYTYRWENIAIISVKDEQPTFEHKPLWVSTVFPMVES